VFGLATFEEREADLVEFAIHRPEVGGLELARNPLTRLDRRLVHGLDARGANRGELGVVDRFEKSDPLLGDLREPRTTDGDPRIGQTLVLAIERQVVGKFVDQQAGDEAHVGPAAVDDAGRCTGTDEFCSLLQLDHRPAILDHHVTPRPLGQAIAFLVADDLVVFAREAVGCRCGKFDDFDRDARLVEEGHGFIVAGAGSPACGYGRQ
jgi:hypothetical protein